MYFTKYNEALKYHKLETNNPKNGEPIKIKMLVDAKFEDKCKSVLGIITDKMRPTRKETFSLSNYKNLISLYNKNSSLR